MLLLSVFLSNDRVPTIKGLWPDALHARFVPVPFLCFFGTNIRIARKTNKCRVFVVRTNAFNGTICSISQPSRACVASGLCWRTKRADWSMKCLIWTAVLLYSISFSIERFRQFKQNICIALFSQRYCKCKVLQYCTSSRTCFYFLPRHDLTRKSSHDFSIKFQKVRSKFINHVVLWLLVKWASVRIVRIRFFFHKRKKNCVRRWESFQYTCSITPSQ